LVFNSRVIERISNDSKIHSEYLNLGSDRLRCAMQTILAEDLKAGLISGQLTVIDVLPSFSYEAEHIPGAKNVAVFEMAFLDNLGKLIEDKTAAVVVYDTGDGSNAALDAARKMTAAGYSDVRVLEGGLAGWRASGESVEGSGLLLPIEPDAYPSELPVDIHSSIIRWTGRNLGSQHYGTLKMCGGMLFFDSEGKLTGGDLSIDMNSIGVDDIVDKSLAGVLIAHLDSDDFFETDKYPTARVCIESVDAASAISSGALNLKVSASLTLKDITAPIDFDAVGGFNRDGQFNAQASLSFDRTIWNVLYGSGKFYQRLGMHLVNDLIALEIKVAAG